MKMKKFFVAVIILITASFIFSDNRKYVWTYEATLQPKEKLEVENYFTYKVPSKPADPNVVEEWIELEYGISDYLDVSMYQTFKQKTDSSFKYDGFKTRLRYRPWLPGEKFLDLVLYFEPQLRGSSLDEQKMETKIILTKPLGKFSVSSNIIHEWEHERGTKKTVNKYKLQLAGRYEFSPAFSTGIEFETVFLNTEQGKAPNYFIGPTINYGTSSWWFASGIRFGLNNRTNDVEFRTILGLEF